MKKHQEHIGILYMVIGLLLLIILMHHFNGFEYVCCETFGGGSKCWSDSGPGIFTPGWTQGAMDQLVLQCREYPYHAYFDFMRP